MLLAVFFIVQLTAQNKNREIKDVTQAAYNYIDAFYKADTTLAYKSVYKEVRKAGWWFNKKKEAYSDNLEMPFDKLVALAKRCNAKGDHTNADSPRQVKVLEISDKIAVAKVTAQ